MKNMMMGMIAGAAALLLVLVVVMVARRRRPTSAKPAAAAPPVVAEEPQRRRTLGPAVTAPETLLAEPEPAPAHQLPPEPRRRVAIGLTPFDASEPDNVHEEEAAEPLPAPVEELRPSPLAVAAFPLERPAEDSGADPAEPPEDGPPSILAQLKTKKKAGANVLAGAAEGSTTSSTPFGPSEIEESVSLVLRRQVPPRFDEAPRSWLGGLPMMPDAVEWPRAVAPEALDEGEVPLNFVAQIACADFPAALWDGLGPRPGWLLLFLNPRDGQGDDPRIFRVLHIAELGQERAPPEDLPPVVSPDLASGDYLWCASEEQIPGTWRRWPVDLVAGVNDSHDDGYRISVTPKDFARQLHDGTAVADVRPELGDTPPFSWRGALYVVDSILRLLAQPPAAHGVAPAQREALDRPGSVASIIPELRAREQEWLTEGEGAILFKEEPLREREVELRDRIQPIAEQRQQALDRLAAFIVDYPTGAAIAKRVEADRKKDIVWRREAAERLEAIRAQILSHSLDTKLDPADWAALRDDLASQRHARWIVEWTSRNSEFPVMIIEQERSLFDLAAAGIEAAVVQLAADYQADPELSALVPAALRDRLEPHWRALTDNRPHRIGGFHDGLQSEPEEGPQGEVLLFQIASDEAMHWMWGDGGAYFIFITPRDLAAGQFDHAEIRLEQP
ncbi:MAG: DUF1963 domain-containing protein [Sphingomonas bacterium]|nr:DUF1963 domain-containing protein [Sphingomonas bacterium]